LRLLGRIPADAPLLSPSMRRRRANSPPPLVLAPRSSVFRLDCSLTYHPTPLRFCHVILNTTRYLLKTFKLTDGNAFNSLISGAIQRGYDRGVFDLPKGAGGKVMISNGKEVSRDCFLVGKPARGLS
jgi:hypothetical protein